MPKISIILPCYNVEKYIAKSIDSVLAQSYSDFELLAVIDGSPDDSKAIAEEYAIKDNRIKVLNKPNGGLSDARNYGLERANGEYIYFMDSDDWIEPTLLEDNLKIVEEENLDFIIFGYIQDDENTDGELINSKEQVPNIKEWVRGDSNIEIDSHHLGLLGYAWNKIYRKSFLDEHKFRFKKGISLVEDILFNAPIYKDSTKLRFNNKAYYHYMFRPVVTLMRTYHPNFWELKKMRITAIGSFMDSWDINNRKEVLAYSFINGMRESIHSMFAYKNQLNNSQKINNIKEMYSDDISRELIKYYKGNSLKDKIHCFMVKYKLAYTTFVFAKIIK